MLAFVCGPIVYNRELVDFLSVHRRAKKLAVGVSVIARQHAMTELFDFIIARDGTHEQHFDIAVVDYEPPALRNRRFTKVGLCLRGAQSEYGRNICQNEKSDGMLRGLAHELNLETLEIDTVIGPDNSPSQILEKFEAVDIILTTRLHGSLFGLSKAKPIIAVDQIAGGAKVTSVLNAIEWPYVFQSNTISLNDLKNCVERWEDCYPIDAIIASQANARRAARQTIALAVSLITEQAPSIRALPAAISPPRPNSSRQD